MILLLLQNFVLCAGFILSSWKVRKHTWQWESVCLWVHPPSSAWRRFIVSSLNSHTQRGRSDHLLCLCSICEFCSDAFSQSESVNETWPHALTWEPRAASVRRRWDRHHDWRINLDRLKQDVASLCDIVPIITCDKKKKILFSLTHVRCLKVTVKIISNSSFCCCYFGI